MKFGKVFYCLFFLFIFGVQHLNGQQWLWAKECVRGGGFNAYGDPVGDHSVVTDKFGNSYTTGLFGDTISFGAFTVRSRSIGAYLVKYDSNGTVLWAQQAVPVNREGYAVSQSVALDTMGNLFITGYFVDTISFGSDTLLSYPQPSDGDVFVAKYDNNGTLLWVKQAGLNSSLSFGMGISVSTDVAGNVYLTGEFGDTISFGSNTLVSTQDTTFFANSTPDIFIAKYDANGNAIWAKQAKQANAFSRAYGCSIACDKYNGVYVAGYYEDTVTLGPLTMVTHISNQENAFIAKLDTGGNFSWVKPATIIGAYSGSIGITVATDVPGNVYFTGIFYDTLAFGPYILKNGSLFLTKFDSSGNVLWAKQNIALDSGNYVGYSLATDTEKEGGGYLAVVGNSVHNNPHYNFRFGGKTFVLNTTKQTAAILLKFDSSGNTLCGSIFSEGDEDDGDGVGVSPSGKYVSLVGDMDIPGYIGADSLPYGGDMPFWSRWENCCGGTSITGNTSICPGFSTSLSALGGFGNYLWSTGDTSSSITVSPSKTQEYSVTINEGTCISIDSAIVNIKPIPVITFSGDSFICKGDTGYIIASGGDTYKWNTGATTDTIFVQQNATATYTLQVTKAGCIGDSTITIPVKPLPTGNVTFKSSICYGDTSELSASGGTIYYWNNGDTTAAISVSPLHTSTYSVTISNGQCSVVDSATVVVNLLPTLNLCCDSVISSGQSVQLTSSGGKSYSWSPPTGLSCDTCPNPLATPAQTTTYTLTITSDSGCINQSKVTIIIEDNCGEVFVPNVFAPDETVHNNILYVRGNCIASMDFDVFDRWGNKVFESQNPDNGWNGSYNGTAMNMGTYIWYLKATLRDGTSIEKKGNVTLVR